MTACRMWQQRVPQKLERLLVHVDQAGFLVHPGILRMQRQAVLGRPVLHQSQRGLSLLSRAAQDHRRRRMASARHVPFEGRCCDRFPRAQPSGLAGRPRKERSIKSCRSGRGDESRGLRTRRLVHYHKTDSSFPSVPRHCLKTRVDAVAPRRTGTLARPDRLPDGQECPSYRVFRQSLVPRPNWKDQWGRHFFLPEVV